LIREEVVHHRVLLPVYVAHLRPGEREFFIDNLLVRIHFIIMMIRWTGLAPWEFEFPFPGSLIYTFLVGRSYWCTTAYSWQRVAHRSVHLLFLLITLKPSVE